MNETLEDAMVYLNSEIKEAHERVEETNLHEHHSHLVALLRLKEGVQLQLDIVEFMRQYGLV